MAQVRQTLPNDYELSLRDDMKRADLFVSMPNVSEFCRVRRFSDDERASLHLLQNDERTAYGEKCRKYEDWQGIFYAQFRKGASLSEQNLEALDFMQNIPESSLRIIYHAEDRCSLLEFQKRVLDFMTHNPGKQYIPLLYPEVTSKAKEDLLRDKVLWLILSGHKKIGFKYYASKAATKGLESVVALIRAANIEVYFFQLPIQKDGCSHIFRALFLGADKVCHRRSQRVLHKVVPKFLDPDWSLKTLALASAGGQLYGNKNRKEFLQADGRKSFLYNFARWDLLVQSNLLCREQLGTLDIKTIPELKQTIRKLFK